MLISKENLYFDIRHTGGWLRLIEMIFLVKEFEELEDQVIQFEMQQEKYYNNIVVPETKKQEFEFIREIEKEIPDEIIKIKEKCQENLIKKYIQIIKNYEESTWKGILIWLANIVKELNNPENLLKKIKRLQIEIDFLRKKKEIKENEITDNDIVRAKQYPFENLIQVNKRGFAFCPFHKEKTESFYVKNNFGFCFGCQKAVDTIAFVMEIRNMNFIEAIKFLQ